MLLNGKRVDLIQLRAEMVAASLTVRGLGINADDLHTYDASGAEADVPAGAAAVIAAHVPPAIPDTPDFGSDVPAPTDIATLVQQGRAYLALASPTTAQTTAAVKGLVKLALFLVRRALA